MVGNVVGGDRRDGGSDYEADGGGRGRLRGGPGGFGGCGAPADPAGAPVPTEPAGSAPGVTTSSSPGTSHHFSQAGRRIAGPSGLPRLRIAGEGPEAASGGDAWADPGALPEGVRPRGGLSDDCAWLCEVALGIGEAKSAGSSPLTH